MTGAGPRFRFGRNWRRFLAVLDAERLAEAEDSLSQAVGPAVLADARFLDVGSGSGLFSLAARRLGARVHSFDYDPQSVACTQELRARFRPGDTDWTIEQGSILDPAYIGALGRFDVVYAWGVLHHTGDMRCALDNAAKLVADNGTLVVAIYNDQGLQSRCWTVVKRLYNASALARLVLIAGFAPYLVGARFVVRSLSGRARPGRGMSLWHDMIDWLGGYPFEVASANRIIGHHTYRGLVLDRMTSAGRRSGCNEYVFRRPSGDSIAGVEPSTRRSA